jgi:hypothetical protein
VTFSAKQQGLLLVAVCAGSGLAHLGTSTMPFQIGALVDGSHRTAGQAGLFGFFEVGALALSMILISGWVDRVRPVAVAVCGCCIVALANSGLCFFGLFASQLALAVLAGLGYGMVFAATVAGAAATKEPDRVYAIGNGGALLIIVAVISALPMAASRFGASGIFAALAGLAAIASPLFAGFKAGKRTTEIRLAAWRTRGAPGLLFAWAAFSMGTGAVYAFSERIGNSIHLPASQIARVLSAGVFVGLVGTGAAALLGRRLHRPSALTIGMCGSGVSCLLLGYATSFSSFAAGVFAYWVFTMFLYSYLLGTAAVLDATGRVGTLAGGVERLGYAAGAGFGGLVAQHTAYSATGLLGFLACATGIALGFPSLFRSLQKPAMQVSPAD